MSALNLLVGLKVQEIRFTHEYFQVFLLNGSILNVYNNYSFCGDVFDIVKNKTVTEIEETVDVIKILFNDVILVIDMNDASYTSPEALSLHHNGTVTVWS